MTRGRVVAVCGTTASRKSELALDLAAALGGEIVCCDSVQIYRGFRIGSAAPDENELARAPHHLYGALEPDDPGDAGRYARLADDVCSGIISRGRVPIMAGGTGLYLRALLNGLAEVPPVPREVRERLLAELSSIGSPALFDRLCRVDPVSAWRIEGGAANTRRVLRALEVLEATGERLSAIQDAHEPVERYEAVLIWPVFPSPVLAARIDARVDAMFAAGLVAEVEGLLRSGVPLACRPMQSLGYRQVASMLHGRTTPEEAIADTKRGHRQYAKRQRTWFRRVGGVVELDGRAPDLLNRALARIGEGWAVLQRGSGI